MNYGFIGAGAIAQALVRRLTAVGESDIVISNSREPETLALLVQQHGVRAGTRADAAAAEIVVLAVPWSRIPIALNGLDFNGRVLIDTTNPLEAPTFQPFDLGGLTSSEVVASHARGARWSRHSEVISEVRQAGRGVLIVVAASGHVRACGGRGDEDLRDLDRVAGCRAGCEPPG